MAVLNTTRYYQFHPNGVVFTREGVSATSFQWYGEYCQSFACRMFAVGSESVAVAPYDIALLDPHGSGYSLPRGDMQEIAFRTFEQLWDEVAQPRLSYLAHREVAPPSGTHILYVKQPFPGSFKHNEPSSELYTEWVNAIARRHFEVFADRVVVASQDPEAAWPDQYEAEVRAVELGIDDSNRPIEPPLRPIALTHKEFERAWESFALERLRVLAGLAPA